MLEFALGTIKHIRREYGQRLALVTIGLSLCMAAVWVPLPWSIGVIVAALACGAALVRPAIGLSLALVLGPGKALALAAIPELPTDLGQLFLALTIAGWLIRSLAERCVRIPSCPFTLPILVYLGVGVLSLWGTSEHQEGLEELIKWLQILAVTFIVIDLSRRDQLAMIIAAALLSGSLQAGFGLWQAELRGVGPDAFEISSGHYRAYGTFEQPNPFGGYMGLIWPLALVLAISGLRPSVSRWRTDNITHSIRILAATISCLVVAGVTGLALFASHSRGALIGAVAAVGVMLIASPRSRLASITLAVAGICLSLLMLRSGTGNLNGNVPKLLESISEITKMSDVRGANITSSNFSLIERFAHWQAAVNMATTHPLLGVGLGRYEDAYPDFRLSSWKHGLGHAHNVYLNVAAETGLLGLAAYLLLCGVVLASTLRAIAQSLPEDRLLGIGLLGVWTHIAVHSLVDNLLVNNVHIYLGTLLGLLAVLIDRRPVALWIAAHRNA